MTFKTMADVDCELIPLDGIDLSCEDTPVGGLTDIWIAEIANVGIAVADKSVLADGTVNQSQGEVQALGFRDEDETTPTGIGKVYRLDFNKRDAATGFVENKVTSADGVSVNTQTLTWALPKMNREKRNLVNRLVHPTAEHIMFLKYATGDYAAIGVKFSIRATAGDGTSGANRSDKNGFTVTFVAEETELQYFIHDPELIGILEAKTTMADIPDTADWEVSIATEESFAPNQDVAPKKASGSVPAPTNLVGTYDDVASEVTYTWTNDALGVGEVIVLHRYSNNPDWVEVSFPAGTETRVIPINYDDITWVEVMVKTMGAADEDGIFSEAVRTDIPPTP